MANVNIELLEDAIQRLRASLKGNLVEVQDVRVGLPITSLPEVTPTKSTCYIQLTSGSMKKRGLGGCDIYSENLNLKFYWLLTTNTPEQVEVSVARMLMQIHGIYRFNTVEDKRIFTTDIEFHLKPTRDFQDATFAHQLGYEELGGKMHRVLIQPAVLEVELT